MRLSVLTLIVVAALAAVTGAQAPAAEGGQEPRRRPRLPAELSEPLVHSPLVRCDGGARCRLHQVGQRRLRLAVLSRWPLVDVRRHRLDRAEAGEPRILLEVIVCAAGRPLRVFNHHADGRPVSREPGLAALRAIVTPAVGRGVLLLGDFNEQPEAPAVRGLIDAGFADLGGILNMQTTPGGRIDYLLADAALIARASGARVWSTDLSDHHAVVADLGWYAAGRNHDWSLRI